MTEYLAIASVIAAVFVKAAWNFKYGYPPSWMSQGTRRGVSSYRPTSAPTPVKSGNSDSGTHAGIAPENGGSDE